MTQTLKTLIPLAIVFSILVATNFIYAAWGPPSGIPSASNNAPPPINESTQAQTKEGNLVARSFRAGVDVRSPKYCDPSGDICLDVATHTDGGGSDLSSCKLGYRFKNSSWSGPWGLVSLDGSTNTGDWSLWSVSNLDNECKDYSGTDGCGIQMKIVCGGGAFGYTWKTGSWQNTGSNLCTQTNTGTSYNQTRTVQCVEEGTSNVVNNSNCTDTKPSKTQVSGSCNTQTCFIAGTDVTMADGSTKNIEDVVIGEQVRGNDGAVNTVEGYDRPMLGERLLYSFNGGPYFVTAEHPFLTTEGWKSVSAEAFQAENAALAEELEVTTLEIGDEILRSDGTTETIVTIDSRAETDQRLYNFRLDGDSTYTADGYVTHNK